VGRGSQRALRGRHKGEASSVKSASSVLKQEIVGRLETCFALADQLELRLAKARGQVDQLTPSLLARACAGKLVPQDPNDEPASALLERIRKVGRSISEMATVSDDETPSKTGRILWLRPFTSRKVRGVVSVRGELSVSCWSLWEVRIRDCPDCLAVRNV